MRHAWIPLAVLLVAFSVSPLAAHAATIYSNSSTGDDATGSGTSGAPYKTFHKAYTSASSGDTINLTGTFTWTDAAETGDAATSGYTLSKNLTIQGQGADVTTVQAHASDNTADRRVFTVANTYAVTFNDLLIRHGKVGSSQYGAGIDVVGTATIDSCDISYNRATDGGGGGVNVWGAATVQNSTIHHNVASYMGGGLNRHYYTSGNGTPNGTNTLVVINSTISSNTVTQSVAYLEGAGIFYRRGSGSITNSTITLNQITNGSSSSTHGVGTGDGAGTIQIKNNIISGNIFGTYGGDIGHRENGYGVYADNGGNIIGRRGYYSGGFTPALTSWMDAANNSASLDGTFVLQNGAGTTTGTLSLDSALATNSTTNGTKTFAITSATSIAINNGLTGSNGATTTVPTLDQRGASRSGNTDIGAYEYGGDLGADVTVPTVSVTTPSSDATVAGTSVSLTASASDDTAVAGVTFYVDNVRQGVEDTTSIYGITWDSTGTSSGSHTLIAVARDTSNNYATSTSVSFTVDNTAAGLSLISVATATTTATITWTSDEAASSLVRFGVTSSYGTSTPETNTDSRVTSHSVSLVGLKACVRYHYQVRSTDASANIASSSDATFLTTGCSGSSSVSSTAAGSIMAAAGGSLTEGRLTLTVPTSFTTATTSAVFQANQLDATAFFSSIDPPTGKNRAGSTVFNLKALTDATTTLSSFEEPLSVTLSYTAEEVEDLDETSLSIYRYDDTDWNALSSCVTDTSAKTVTCETTQFSDFAIFGDEAVVETTSIVSSGTTASGRIRNLLTSRNYKRAAELLVRFPEALLEALPVQGATQLPEELETSKRVWPLERDLTVGAVGDDVRLLQEALITQSTGPAATALGAIGATGYFGAYTRDALAEYQAAEHIAPAYGYYGPRTRAHVVL